jgi:hypothetical protein
MKKFIVCMVVLMCPSLVYAASFGTLSTFPPDWLGYGCTFNRSEAKLDIENFYGCLFPICIGYAETTDQDYQLTGKITFSTLNEYGLVARANIPSGSFYYCGFNAITNVFAVKKVTNFGAIVTTIATAGPLSPISSGTTLRFVWNIFTDENSTKITVNARLYSDTGTQLAGLCGADVNPLTGATYGTYAGTPAGSKKAIKAHYSDLQINSVPRFDGQLSDWNFISSTGISYNSAPGLHEDPLGDNVAAFNQDYGDGVDMIRYGARVTTLGARKYLNFAWELAHDGPTISYFVDGWNTEGELFMEALIDVDRNGGPGTPLGSASSLYPDPGGNFLWWEWTASFGSYDKSAPAPNARENNRWGTSAAFEGADIDLQWAVPYNKLEEGNNDRGFGFYGDGIGPIWYNSGLPLHDNLYGIGYHYWGFDPEGPDSDRALPSGMRTVGPDQGDGKGLVVYDPHGWTVEYRVPIDDIVAQVRKYPDNVTVGTTWRIGMRVNTTRPGRWLGDNSGNGDPAHASAGTIIVPVPIAFNGHVAGQGFLRLNGLAGTFISGWYEDNPIRYNQDCGNFADMVQIGVPRLFPWEPISP